MKRINRLLENKTILIIALLYSGAITYLFLLPSSDLPKVNLPAGTDKVVHLAIYLGFAFLWQLYLFRKNGKLSRFHILMLLVGSLLYGIIIEVLQGLLTTSRSPDIWDVAANMVGTLLGIFVFKKIRAIFIP